MSTGPIQHQDHLHLGTGLLADEPQVVVHVLGVGQGGQQSRRVAGQGIDRREHVHPFILALVDRSRTRAGQTPTAGQGSLLTDAGFVLDPNFDPLARVFLRRFLDKRGVSSRHRCICAGSLLG